MIFSKTGNKPYASLLTLHFAFDWTKYNIEVLKSIEVLSINTVNFKLEGAIVGETSMQTEPAGFLIPSPGLAKFDGLCVVDDSWSSGHVKWKLWQVRTLGNEL